MFSIRKFHRPIPRFMKGLGVLMVAALICSASSISAFQSFEEFSRSKNNKYNIDVTLFTDPAEAKPGEDFDLHLRVKLSPGWHIYSLESQDKDETLATQIRLNENVFQAKGQWLEPKPTITLDGALNKVVKIHEDAVRFSRNLMVPGHLKPETYSISGNIEFRACDNKICTLPREVGFKTQIRILGEDDKL